MAGALTAAPAPTAPAATSGARLVPALLLACGVAGFAAVTWLVGWRQGFLWLIGLGYGMLLSAAAFGFTTGWRVWITRRDPVGILAQFLAIAVAMLLSVPLLAAHPELEGADGPLSISLLVGSFVFGAAMQVADGCGSGTLYKAGLGHPISLAVLPAFVIGSFLGAAQIPAWLALGALPPVDLVQRFGAGATLAMQLGALGLLGAIVWRFRGSQPSRWRGGTIWWAAIGLALLAAANLVVGGQPWGIVYGLGLWGAKIVQALGVDLSGNAYWGLPAQQAQLHSSLLADNTSITDLGLFLGALIAATRMRKACPSVPATRRQWIASIVAGVVLGYTSRIAFGCNIGAYFSGIATGSLHGWIWFGCAFAGSLVGVRLRHGLGMRD